MSKENTQLISMSPSMFAITFNKNGISAIREGGAQAVDINVGGKKARILIMRDTAFAPVYKKFVSEEVEKNEGFRGMVRKLYLKLTFREARMVPTETTHRKYRK